jgi:hypothetical protein
MQVIQYFQRILNNTEGWTALPSYRPQNVPKIEPVLSPMQIIAIQRGGVHFCIFKIKLKFFDIFIPKWFWIENKQALQSEKANLENITTPGYRFKLVFVFCSILDSGWRGTEPVFFCRDSMPYAKIVFEFIFSVTPPSSIILSNKFLVVQHQLWLHSPSFFRLNSVLYIRLQSTTCIRLHSTTYTCFLAHLYLVAQRSLFHAV